MLFKCLLNNAEYRISNKKFRPKYVKFLNRIKNLLKVVVETLGEISVLQLLMAIDTVTDIINCYKIPQYDLYQIKLKKHQKFYKFKECTIKKNDLLQNTFCTFDGNLILKKFWEMRKHYITFYEKFNILQRIFSFSNTIQQQTKTFILINSFVYFPISLQHT